MKLRWTAPLLALAVAFAALPALVGVLTQSRVQSALAERWPEVEQVWQRGWRQSRLVLRHDQLEAEIELEHLPLSPPGWLALRGRVRIESPPARVDLTGRLGLTGRFELNGRSDALVLPGPPQWRYHQPGLRVTGDIGQTLAIELRSSTLDIADSAGNRLALTDTVLQLTVRQAQQGPLDLELGLQLTRAGQAESRLQLALAGLDHDALIATIEAVRNLSTTEVGSAAHRLAQLSVLGALQQLADAGLAVLLEPLLLDGRVRVHGHWQPGQPPQITGGGPPATLHTWLAAIVGLHNGLAANEAHARASEQLAAIRQRGLAEGWLQIQGDEWRIELPGPGHPGPP
ncbi:MAG: hypothetical protein RQ729_02555 [Wenzhouxiangellaceae bacterium]|nr:hypothetical protein [Wenzhouxiangellaceae bacterium]